MEKRSVILITFLFTESCSAGRALEVANTLLNNLLFCRETKACQAPLERRDPLAGGYVSITFTLIKG